MHWRFELFYSSYSPVYPCALRQFMLSMKSFLPPAPVGCLQYYKGITGEFKSFNFDGVGCYSEDRWCDFSRITHASDCDIRVGFTGKKRTLATFHLELHNFNKLVKPRF